MLPESCRSEVTIDRPSVQDWSLFEKWAAGEGWRVPVQERALYRHELADDAFALREEAGRPLGFVTVCRHQRSAWIGNLIVDPARRGERFGRRLFEHAVGTLSARGVAPLWLTASVDGRPLYETCGFREAGRIERWVWRGEGQGSVRNPSEDKGTLYPLARADAAAWGVSRVGLLTLLARGGRVLSAGSTLALLQAGDDLCVLGPWLSSDLCPRSNRAVLHQALESVNGAGEIALDVLGGSPVRILLHAAGFRQSGETVLMLRGEPGVVKFGEIVSLASLGSMG
jgi:GNAT superfamily N-acetyltransferase